jgi:Uncharacterized protein conserved in bacteria (DUF2252).
MARKTTPPAVPETDPDPEDVTAPPSELAAAGRAHRKVMPRSAHADYTPAADRDPIGILQRQHRGRDPKLVELRVERMLRNPYAFHRGSAAIQAADLAHTATTGRDLTICGDPHLAAFGLFAHGRHGAAFDIGDLDDAGYGAWEWDLKRFVSSVVIAAKHKRLSDDRTQTAALQAAASYRIALRQYVELGTMDRRELRTDPTEGLRESNPQAGRPSSQKVVDHALRAMRKRAVEHGVHTITTHTQGTLTFVKEAPRLTALAVDDAATVAAIVAEYRRVVAPDIALMLAGFREVDAAARVVGVASVGIPRYLVALTGPDDEPVVLEISAAVPSVVTAFGGGAAFDPALADRTPADDGERLVAAHSILHAVADPFLARVAVGDAVYLVRRFRDGSVAIDIDELDRRTFLDYVDACGTVLARAHAQSPNAPFIAGYVGSNTTFDQAIASWATAYAEQSDADYRSVRKAVRDGASLVAQASLVG